MAMANWSMMPQLTPLNPRSAAWHRSAFSMPSISHENISEKISAVSTSIDAEELKPDPLGIVPRYRMSMPAGARYPRFSISAMTPFG